jgi:hypothetical protein
MFEDIIPLIKKDSFIIFDIHDTVITRNKPYHFTDLDGFIHLFKYVKGNIMFLTAHPSKKEVQRGFKDVGLNYDDFNVLYSNIPKGLFLKQYSYPSNTVFIDNSLRQINSVRKHCPDILAIHFTR